MQCFVFDQHTGYTPSDKVLQEMVKEAPAQINFTVFLSLFSEKLSGEYEMTAEAPGAPITRCGWSTRNMQRNDIVHWLIIYV